MALERIQLEKKEKKKKKKKRKGVAFALQK
jgi:hypothetical protein